MAASRDEPCPRCRAAAHEQAVARASATQGLWPLSPSRRLDLVRIVGNVHQLDPGYMACWRASRQLFAILQYNRSRTTTRPAGGALRVASGLDEHHRRTARPFEWDLRLDVVDRAVEGIAGRHLGA